MSQTRWGRRGAARHNRSGFLLATTLGGVALWVWSTALAQTPPGEVPREEVTITASRLSDAVLTAKVEQALHDDPYIFSNHMSVVTENGIVRLQGVAVDLSDLRQALALARRIAGKSARHQRD